MDKSGPAFRYEAAAAAGYGQPQGQHQHQPTMHKNNNKSALSRVQAHAFAYRDRDRDRDREDDDAGGLGGLGGLGGQACFCFESDDDSADRIRLKSAKRKLARGCLANLMICAILVGYTFIGAVIFLIVEGDSGLYSMAGAGRTNKAQAQGQGQAGGRRAPAAVNSSWLARIGDESRAKAVENIWDITVSLNILYRENWTRLAAQEMSRFQDQLVQRLAEEAARHPHSHSHPHSDPDAAAAARLNAADWNLAKAFLYSLTVLTTIGYGNITPRTSLGKAVTMGYAALGIPLMLIYLSSMGSLLSGCARHLFTRSLCCCLCSNCGYCCYDEKRMQEKERRTRKRREQKEYEQRIQRMRHQAHPHPQEPYYVRSPSAGPFAGSTPTGNSLHSPSRDPVKTSSSTMLDSDCLSSDASLLADRPAAGCLAPLTLCFLVMVVYICGGAVVLCRLESSWSFLDSIFFCFMTLSTIGFGDSIPSTSVLSTKVAPAPGRAGGFIVWFCSLYILAGMALTAMCFNVVHDEIVHKLKHRYGEGHGHGRMTEENSVSTKLGSANFLDGDAVAVAVATAVDYPPAS